MKHLFSSFCFALLLLFTHTLTGQNVPQGMRYQAVARDLTGQPIVNKEIGLEISMLVGSPNGKNVYQEIHHVQTDALGMFAITVGEGAAENGRFAAIPWSSEDIWLQLAVDETGGNNFKILTASRLLTVPYAFHAGSAETLSLPELDEEKRACGPTGLPFWSVLGNANVNDTCHFIGTTIHQDFIFKTNNIERMRITADGEIIINADLNINDNLIVTDDSVLVHTSLYVDHDASIGDDLDVGGNGHFGGDVDVDGDGNFENIHVNNDASIGHNTTVGNDVSIGGDLDVNGNTSLTNLSTDNFTTNFATVNQQLDVNGKTNTRGLTVAGPGMLGPNGEHVAFFENTTGGNQDGIAIKIDNASTNGENNFTTFYNGVNQAIGRIEGYSFPNDWVSPPPFPSPTLDIDLGLEWENVDFGLFSLTVPTGYHTPSIEFGGVDPSDFADLICWAQETGLDAFITTNPFDIAIAAGVMTIAAACNDGGVTYASKGADYAEWLPRELPEEKMMAGMIVGVKNGKISKTTQGADQIMAISMQPIVLGNIPQAGHEAEYEKVGFLGQVPVLVQGNVKVGDYIVPSGNNDGVGRAIAPENLQPSDLPAVLGKAWSASTNDRISMINVAIGLNRNDLAGFVQQQQDKIQALEAKLQAMQTGLEAQMNALEAKINALNTNTANK